MFFVLFKVRGYEASNRVPSKGTLAGTINIKNGTVVVAVTSISGPVKLPLRCGRSSNPAKTYIGGGDSEWGRAGFPQISAILQ